MIVHSNVLGKVLRILRASDGLSSKEAAARLGVTPAALSQWERGAAFPSIPRLRDIAALYGMHHRVLVKLLSDTRRLQTARVSLALEIVMTDTEDGTTYGSGGDTVETFRIPRKDLR